MAKYTNKTAPPSQPTSTAYAVANPQSQPFHCIYGVAAIFNCHTFVAMRPRFLHIACFASLDSKKVKPRPTA